METPLVADTFVELLERSGLLTGEQVAAAVDRLALRRLSAPRDVARVLVRDGLLTRFQAERLLEGRYRGFFIDHFKVLEILGAGGMACLYLAEDTRTKARVALKVLSDKHKTDPGMLARLKLEARAGKKLKHAGIIRTHSIHGTDDVFGEVFYVVMEFMEGVNLEELINLSGPIPWRQAADFIRQAAGALHYAHSQGMIHRDVKPGNLLVDAAGTVKILDFGLALLDSAEDDEFSLAMIFGHNCLGTADYIAPEQSLDSSAIDARADIYSLGCTLYVALAGKLPYPDASPADKLDGHRHRPAPPLRGIVPEVPAALAAVIEKMMAKKPAERYATMAEVEQALAPFGQRLPVAFDFPQVLAWRAKAARRRFAAQRKAKGSSSIASSSWALPGLNSTSTRRLPQATADTKVEHPSRAPQTSVALNAPFEGADEATSLSRPEISLPAAIVEPALVEVGSGKRRPLAGDSVLVGRDADCDVCLPFPEVSGRHCELRFEGDRWRVIDLGSKNGVQVNGVSVADRVLASGDRLSFSRQHHFRFECPAPPPVVSGRSIQWVLGALFIAAATLTGLYVWQRLLD